VKKILAVGEDPVTLVEIGPRFVLEIVRIFQGSFGGPTLYQNDSFVSPNELRHDADVERGGKYRSRVEAEFERLKRKQGQVLSPDPVANVFRAKGSDDEADEADDASDDDDDDDDE
jgi:ribosome biogenesis protein BRX1